MEVVESVAEVLVGGTQKAEGTIAELAEAQVGQPLSLSPGTSQSKTTFCSSRAVAGVA